jgi:hypothetical protein
MQVKDLKIAQAFKVVMWLSKGLFRLLLQKYLKTKFIDCGISGSESKHSFVECFVRYGI